MIEPEKSTHDIDVRMTVSDLGNADEEAVRSPAATSAEGHGLPLRRRSRHDRCTSDS
jgi:hypothetical protein